MHDVISAWQADPDVAGRIAHVERVPARDAIFEDIDPPIDGRVAGALAAGGIERLYRHQAQVIRRAREGIHTVAVAGTASGKSLGYQVPIAEAAIADRKSTSLLLFPTKALAQDQFRSLHGFGIPEIVPITYDGDTDKETRAWARRHATAVLTNPDMLHIGILPAHGAWASFFSRLQYVVIDEIHVLRGIFGSHVGNVLRRLRRVAAHYGANPTFLASSATIGNPGHLVEALTGLPFDVVDQDTSPAGATTYVVWNPEDEEDDLDGTRRSALAETTDVLVDLVGRGHHTIAFARSRKGTELVYRWARERLPAELAGRIAPYRAGYLPSERRAIEARLFDGDLLGVVATNALELGIDVGGLDAAIITTFPGTISSFRQQAGRAGRRLDESMAVLVAGEDALDQWFVRHPEQLLARASEAAVVNPSNPTVLAAHAGCAAYELPLDPAKDIDVFGGGIEEIIIDMVGDHRLRVRDSLAYWAMRERPAPGIDIRTAGGPAFTIVTDEGDILGTVDEARVFSQAHPGAVYLHHGDGFVVEELDLETRLVTVAKREVGYYTQPQVETDVWARTIEGSALLGRFGHHHGAVEVHTQVVAFKRRSLRDGSVISHDLLDLPSKQFTTQAVWFTVPDSLLAGADISKKDAPGTLHAAEHTAIALLPLIAICDRWDVGGLSTPFHPDLGGAGWFIYDGYPGGAGIAPVAFESGERHLRSTLEALRSCDCTDGCPSCVQSPKCGNFNDPLDKHGAIRLLEAGLR
ncbi:DEAD/DEAH box helicase [bacterium]|nr:DEAD/DEAH box helicase [bacterium]